MELEGKGQGECGWAVLGKEGAATTTTTTTTARVTNNNKVVRNNLREVGSTLPEDTSREGGGVEVQGWRRGAGRQLGRLGAIQKNKNPL